MTTPMMSCGHAANSVHVLADGTREPACVICSCFEVVESPNLEGRTARCVYYGLKTHHNECRTCPRDGYCSCEKPSSVDLAFFSAQLDQPHDSFYCGCHSWD